jgi:hypothetical protein
MYQNNFKNFKNNLKLNFLKNKYYYTTMLNKALKKNWERIGSSFLWTNRDFSECGFLFLNILHTNFKY